MGVSSLQAVFGALIPFVLVALVQFYRSTVLTTSGIERKPAAQQQARRREAGPAPFNGQLEPGMLNVSASLRLHHLHTPSALVLPEVLVERAGSKATRPATPSEQTMPARVTADISREWPLPTKSSKRLVDGSPNWLPVPNAEGPDPDDLAWRKLVQPTGPCPLGRRPYHTILTAQNSLYQQWQTKIFYYHFRRVQHESGRCTELTGFTRLLAGKEDELGKVIPTVVVQARLHHYGRQFMPGTLRAAHAGHMPGTWAMYMQGCCRNAVHMHMETSW